MAIMSPRISPKPASRAASAPLQPHAKLCVDGIGLACGDERVRLNGVTYGPFAPDETGCCLPPRDVLERDCAQMQAMGLNAVRTYHAPPDWAIDRLCGEA